MTTHSSRVPTWLLMTALVLAEITSTFEASMAFVAPPALSRHFGDPLMASWTISAFFIVSAGTAALFARLGDIYGRRRLLILVLIVAAIGSLVSACSQTLSGVIAGRMLQGITGAVLPLCLGLIRENLQQRQVSMCIGIMGGVVGVSAGLGFLVAGYLLDHIQWQGMFFFSASIAVLGALAVRLVLPRSTPAPDGRKLDILGGLYFVPAISCLMLALNLSRNGWTQWHVLGLLALGLVLLITWVRHEWLHPNPLIDIRLFADRRILLANVVFGLLAVGPMLYPQVLLSLAQQPMWTGIGLGLTATAAALLKQPGTFMGFIAGPLGGRIATRYGSRQAVLTGTLIVALGWTPTLIDMNSFWMLLLTATMQAFGMVVLYGAVSNQIVDAAPPLRTSEALGLAQVTRATFTAAGSQIIAALLAYSTITGDTSGTSSYPSASAYSLAFGYLALVSSAAVVAAWLLPRTRPAAQQRDNQTATPTASRP